VKTLLIALISLIATPALAADLTCTVPSAAIPRAQELCEELRVSLRVRPADWSNDVCATELLRQGLLQAERKVTKREAQATVNTAISDAVSAYEGDHPRAVTHSFCGDGITDSEFGEECDGGGSCTADCRVQ
jgi:hypothetical protein